MSRGVRGGPRQTKTHVRGTTPGELASETLKVSMQERIIEVEEDAVKCGGSFRLRSGSAD